ncbi:packaged DNA stabilization gp4 family protein [Lelliottia wanjuensis]|uniref:Packaged DNA stabilization gp4 family protein n=1 Tax=Lelliottia wanjuensis TaxID=3050585 RepID=A0AAP4FUX6_9ENTR|nr:MULTISPECIES: packaged DNA stabilization gp4 family protein [unclassified Lelliottia]MDK9364175.1 packaged DNA stabilization gp4 family protein [Lelliottia sp. V106_12]MDK9617148.1 packaged DNA stabilization gp4 family protein [Lelliottia sp. V106_9]
MFTKQKIVDAAFVKASVGRSESLTGFSGDDMADALNELEMMMADWEGKGWDLCYQFADPTDSEATATPRPNEPAMIDRRWNSAVTSNLAIRICTMLGLSPSAEVAAEAYNGTLELSIAFVNVPDKSKAKAGSMATYGLLGSGNAVKKW